MSQEMKNRALRLVLHCVRNTQLEDLHAGTAPSSKTGDYSDVIVKSPYGEIPWVKLSRFSDNEMKSLMIEIVNKVYTFLLYEDQLKRSVFFTTPVWNEPEVDEELKDFVERIQEKTGGGGDTLSLMEKTLQTWCDYSSDPAIFEHMQYHQGILVGLLMAGEISFFEFKSEWEPKVMKRCDTLRAIRRAIKRKQLRARTEIDGEEIERLQNGQWIAVDYSEKAASQPSKWEDLRNLREGYQLVPVSLFKEPSAS